MLDHVSITVSSLSRAAPFWDAVMAALGVPCVARRDGMIGYGARNRPGDDGHTYLSVRESTGAVVADNRHWCFRAPGRVAVEAFHAAGFANGGRCDGAPGLRPDYHPAYYAAFLLDPDGNRVEAVCHRIDAAGLGRPDRSRTSSSNARRRDERRLVAGGADDARPPRRRRPPRSRDGLSVLVITHDTVAAAAMADPATALPRMVSIAAER